MEISSTKLKFSKTSNCRSPNKKGEEKTEKDTNGVDSSATCIRSGSNGDIERST